MVEGPVLIKNIERADRFAPRVAQALTLRAVTGEADEVIVDATSMVDQQVVMWDGVAGKFYTAGITQAELGVLDGVTPGIATALKALVVDVNKDIGAIRNLSGNTLTANTLVGAALSVIGTATIATLSVYNTLSVAMNVVSDLKFSAPYGLKIARGATDYYGIRRNTTTDAILVVGNVTDSLILETSATDVMHKRGATSYKIWDAYNDGAGSGLDADLLDGQHGSFYRDASNINVGTLSLSRLPGTRVVVQKRTFCFDTDESGFLTNTGLIPTNWILVDGTSGVKSTVLFTLPAKAKLQYLMLNIIEEFDGSGGIDYLYLRIGKSVSGQEYLPQVDIFGVAVGILDRVTLVEDEILGTQSVVLTLDNDELYDQMTQGFLEMYFTYIDQSE